MKKNDGYIAKEAFMFPLCCLVCMAFNICWGYTDGWSVGAIIGTLFFAFVVLFYVGKYIRCGRNYLKIDSEGIEVKDLGKITTLKWSDIKKCEVYYKPMSAGFTLWSRELFIITQTGGKIFVNLSGKYCCNKSVIEAIERFGGIDIFDRQSSNSQNRYLAGIFLVGIMVIILLAFISCHDRHDLTDNYSVFTYGEGLYGESEQDYPIFVSKLGFAGEPKFVPNVRQVWWSETEIIIEQDNDSWWIITASDKKLTTGDTFTGPLSKQQKDSIVFVDKMNPDKMKYRNYE